MLNVSELESKWLKYKIKSFMPYIVISVSTAIIAFSVYFIYDSDIIPTASTQEKSIEAAVVVIKAEPQDIKPQIVEKKTVVPNDKVEIAKIEPVSNVPAVDKVENEKITLIPSMDFIEKIRTNSSANIQEQKSKPKEVKVTSKKEESKEKKVKKESVKDKPENNSINFTRQNTYEDINHVIGRFNNNNNPALSLFVAKKYYEIGEYKNAYNYALITNEINNNIEASWIVFAKSLVMLDKKDKAIQTLQKYVNHSKSNKAKMLLDEIISGKFNDR